MTIQINKCFIKEQTILYYLKLTSQDSLVLYQNYGIYIFPEFVFLRSLQFSGLELSRKAFPLETRFFTFKCSSRVQNLTVQSSNKGLVLHLECGKYKGFTLLVSVHDYETWVREEAIGLCVQIYLINHCYMCYAFKDM